MKWLALALFACPAAAETLAIHTICLPIEVWQDRLQTDFGETEMLTGWFEGEMSAVTFGRVDGSWTTLVRTDAGLYCMVGSGGAWTGFMIPQGEEG